jgi:hypothetical protein
VILIWGIADLMIISDLIVANLFPQGATYVKFCPDFFIFTFDETAMACREKAQFDRDRFLSLSWEEKSNHSEEDTRAIFADDRMTLIMKDGERMNESHSVRRIYSYKLCLAKLAQLSPDGKFLVLPEGHEWGFENCSTRYLFIRQAYKDHWEIIRHRNEAHEYHPIIYINGTSGGGKTVEGLYLLHQILNSSDEAPPLVYSIGDSSVLVHFRGLYFQGNDAQKFSGSLSYKIMTYSSCDTKAGIWHIGSHFKDNYPLGTNVIANGPQIVLTSPYRQEKEIRPYRKHYYRMIYLPLPSLEEMEDIRVALFGESEESRYFVSHEKMLDLIEEYGCNPWTIFSWKYHEKDNRRRLKERIDHYTFNIDGILDVLTSSNGNTFDSITDGDILHIVPHYEQCLNLWRRHQTT